jgi:hypothetical protein
VEQTAQRCAHLSQRADDPQPDQMTPAIAANEHFVRPIRRHNLGVVAMLLDQQTAARQISPSAITGSCHAQWFSPAQFVVLRFPEAVRRGSRLLPAWVWSPFIWSPIFATSVRYKSSAPSSSVTS